jgi:hypothetical protein
MSIMSQDRCSNKHLTFVDAIADTQDAETSAHVNSRGWYRCFGALWASQLGSCSAVITACLEMFLGSC